MYKEEIEVTHKTEQDFEAFRQSIDTYDNPTYSGRYDSRTNSDGSVTTTLQRDDVRDFGRLGEDVKLTGGSLEIGVD